MWIKTRWNIQCKHTSFIRFYDCCLARWFWWSMCSKSEFGIFFGNCDSDFTVNLSTIQVFANGAIVIAGQSNQFRLWLQLSDCIVVTMFKTNTTYRV